VGTTSARRNEVGGFELASVTMSCPDRQKDEALERGGVTARREAGASASITDWPRRNAMPVEPTSPARMWIELCRRPRLSKPRMSARVSATVTRRAHER